MYVSIIIILAFSLVTISTCEDVEERITGGVNSYFSSALRSPCMLGPGTFCSANLFSTFWYIVPAHCVPYPGTLGEYIFLSDTRLCRYYTSKPLQPNPRSILAVRHPRYIPGRIGGHDIAVVKGNKQMMSVFAHQYARVPFQGDRSEFKKCVIYGKGATIWDLTVERPVHAGNELVTLKPEYFEKPIINRPTPHGEFVYGLNVTAKHGDCGHYPTHLQRRIMCTVREEGKGACYGDGGAPLMCDLNGNLQTFGILSMIAPAKPGLEPLPFYNTCGHADYIDVYTYLCPYYGWLKSFDKKGVDIIIPPQGCSGIKCTSNHAIILALSWLMHLK